MMFLKKFDLILYGFIDSIPKVRTDSAVFCSSVDFTYYYSSKSIPVLRKKKAGESSQMFNQSQNHP